MPEEYSLLKFITVFSIMVGGLFAFYLYINKSGKFSAFSSKGDIKVLDVKYFSKDKGLVLVEVNKEKLLFSFDNNAGVKLIKTFKTEINEKTDTS